MITLYFKDNVSDKVYQVSVEPASFSAPSLFNVNFAYGRRGSTMNTGKKNTSPLPEADARKMADKLVKEKMAKGYTIGENGSAYTDTDKHFTGILPMLLNPITEEELPKYLQDDEWVAQTKYDGKRILIRKTGNTVEAINRKGLVVGVPQTIIDGIAKLPGDFILDGECVGDFYYPFDLVEPNMLMKSRFSALMKLMDNLRDRYIFYPVCYVGWRSKEYFLKALKDSNEEGIVFKHLYSPYLSGRPNSGGPALKHKFTATANVKVWDVNVQRSVATCLRDGTFCGNVTIPVNKDIPAVGSIIEVRYLYAMPNSKALYQPFYSRLRDDIDLPDDVSSLKYKKEED